MINVLIQNDTKNGAPGDFSLLAPINDLCFNINLFYARAQKSLSSNLACDWIQPNKDNWGMFS